MEESEVNYMFKWFMLGVFLVFLVYTMWHFHLGLHFVTGKRRRNLVILCAIIMACCSTIIIGRFLPAGSFRNGVILFSNYWLGLWIYLNFLFILLDIWRGIRKFLLHREGDFTHHGKVFWGIFILSAALTICGGIHARQLTVNQQNVTVAKQVDGMEKMKVVLVSDFHLGYSIGEKDMTKMVQAINRENPDLVVVAGDIYDNEYDAISKPEEVAKSLRGIRSRYGVYGIYGNHDVSERLVGGFTTNTTQNPKRDSRMDVLMKKANITMLEDQSVLIDGKIQLIGRLDGEKSGRKGNQRKSLEVLMKEIDSSKPVFVLNHEPEHLKDYAAQGVDLLMAGHTHAGQFFPLTITRSLTWENYWGIERSGKSTGAVTSGIGVYGPPLRLLSNSEIMVLNVRFSNHSRNN